MIIEGNLAVDDRGSVRFVNDFDFAGVKRFYQVQNHERGFIRAWHGHLHESKYAYVAKGSILLGVVNLGTQEVTQYTLSAMKPRVIYIPKGNANGFQTLEEDTIVFFFSDKAIADGLADDHRFPYDRWNIWEKNYR